jgi:spermidine/putrescine transport system permease protein
MESATAAARPRGVAAPSRAWSWLRRRALNIYAALAVTYMLVPIAVIAVFSFVEASANRDRLTFAIRDGFTLEYWENAFSIPDLNAALVTSFWLAAASTAASTAIGTLMAIALVRHRFFGHRAANLLIILPMATPEVVLGVALLAYFVTINFDTGFTTIVVAHVMFSISYVVVTVKARTAGFDQAMEEAAQDLGATPWTTFWTVTFPLIFPGILAASLLAFVLSIDDYVITEFNSGSVETLPLWIYGISRFGVPAQVNVVGTGIFAIGII